jgi:hypothetical protein
MAKGRAWARKTFFVLLVLGTVGSIRAALVEPDHFADLLVWIALAYPIAFAPSVRAFFAAPRSFAERLKG